MKLDARKMIIVDLNSGSYNKTNKGHELFNLTQNPIDNNYYGYCPPHDGIVINKLGAKKLDDYIDGILVIYVTKKLKSNNREIIAFCLNARVFKEGQSGDNLARNFKNNDGQKKIATYSVLSDNLIDLSSRLNKFEIKINDYNNQMFRMQRVYGGTYPKLDKKIIIYLEEILENKVLLDNDNNELQEEIQNSEPATKEEIEKSANKPLSFGSSSQGKTITKDNRLSKSALKSTNYTCVVNPNHKTFFTKQGVQYMEGHHLIPCTVTNGEYFMEKFNKNIDCFENIVCVCPNCHREIHY
ncbi:MAG: HNH endonuclease, partial [Bacteroidales bacterium]